MFTRAIESKHAGVMCYVGCCCTQIHTRCLASLIELLAEVLDAEQSLFGKKVRPVEDWLKRYLRSGFVLRYERRKEIAADETLQSRTAHPFVLTPTLVSVLQL